MGYAAARGGDEAIAAAEALIRRGRDGGRTPRLTVDQVTERLGAAVDRLMGEAGLWAPDLAARALRQVEGDVTDASSILRAHRSTLPRFAYSEPTDPAELRVLRRISPAFRNPPGEQLLGRTLDYVGRLLDLMPDPVEDEPAATEVSASTAAHHGHDAPPAAQDAERHPPRLLSVLHSMGLMAERTNPDDPDPIDITRTPARPGSGRSAVLASMARAETGSLVHLWYAARFDPKTHGHEFPGEVRHGYLPVRVEHPVTGKPVQVTEVRVTEVETVDQADGNVEDHSRLDVGYGLCFGHNERKAIAMAGLDLNVYREAGRGLLEQTVVLLLDGVDSSGFLEHLKLPHYVDFRSVIERTRAVQERRGEARAHLLDLSDDQTVGAVR